MSFVPLVRLWILVCAFASAAGWTLSALGQLNRAGYLLAFAAFALILVTARHGWLTTRLDKEGWRMSGHFPSFLIHPRFLVTVRRFRRPLPLCFAALAFLIFVGGALYPPSNYTGVTYHVPRVLEWLSHGQWWWIHTPVVRMNFSGVAAEWLSTPVLLFTQSDRGLFVLNLIPFLLLPGLVFSVFTRLGVRRRVAWQWMWLLPTGYNFLLQAGSICNDTFSAVFALAAVDFGCRAWESRRIRDLWFSILAIALMTGTKATSMPLVLPWLILVMGLLPLLRKNWLPTLPVAAIALVISFFPIAVMNKLHTGGWLGANLERTQLEIHNPLIGIVGNAFQLLLANLVPPIFPMAGWWNAHAPLFMPHWFVEMVNTNFDFGFFAVGEVPTEDASGVGLGVCLLAAVSVVGSLWIRGNSSRSPAAGRLPNWLSLCVLLAAWVSLAAFSMKSGMVTAARLIAPYYALLIPSLLIGPALSDMVRRRWWCGLSGLVLVLAFVVLMVSPDRPLWPARTILTKLHEAYPGERLIDRALRVYTVYAGRWDALAGVRDLLPPDAKAVGFIGTEDDSDISLWRPFGSRTVAHFLLSDPPEKIRSQVQYVVVGGYNLENHHTTLDAWQRQTGAELIAATNATLKVAEGVQPWYVLRLQQ